MPHDIDKKLVVAVASSALFDLTESDAVFREKGLIQYKKYQEDHLDEHLQPGVAFPFVKRLLKLNALRPKRKPIEVILLSRNSPVTGLRVFRSIKHHGLDITRGALLSGGAPYRFIGPLNVSLFLSKNIEDVQEACRKGQPAGLVVSTPVPDDDDDSELRIAFDFDGVIGGDSAEKVNRERGLDGFQASESEKSEQPLEPGPLALLLKKISLLQSQEMRKVQKDPNYKPFLRTSIITARNAPAHERLINTLKSWHVNVDEIFLLGGIQKAKIIHEIKPHIFFDDQETHLIGLQTPAVHIPFGICNQK